MRHSAADDDAVGPECVGEPAQDSARGDRAGHDGAHGRLLTRRCPLGHGLQAVHGQAGEPAVQCGDPRPRGDGLQMPRAATGAGQPRRFGARHMAEMTGDARGSVHHAPAHGHCAADTRADRRIDEGRARAGGGQFGGRRRAYVVVARDRETRTGRETGGECRARPAADRVSGAGDGARHRVDHPGRGDPEDADAGAGITVDRTGRGGERVEHGVGPVGGGVARVCRARTVPSGATSAAAIFVPPRSRPIAAPVTVIGPARARRPAGAVRPRRRTPHRAGSAGTPCRRTR